METRILQANDDAIHLAAELLRSGDVVAFPTETVYGLGANALNANAVEKIFTAKGRPSNNPLIVHVSSMEQAKSLVTYWPESAEILTSALWPGPLTIILPKANVVPDITTASGNTVGLRLPAHPVAQALIQACGFPLAAPSANRSNYISPTTAQHVLRSLNGRIPLVLDGGPCDGGIESTVLDLSKDEVKILRPGLFSANFLSGLLGKPVKFNREGISPDNSTLLSPGQLQTHYSPNTPLFLGSIETIITEWKRAAALDSQQKIGVMIFEDTIFNEAILEWNADASGKHSFKASHDIIIKRMPRDVEQYARQLFATLHELDTQNLTAIYCESPPETPDWTGVLDRLNRAGHNKTKTIDCSPCRDGF